MSKSTMDMDRRKLLGVAAAGGALPLLAACSDESAGQGSEDSSQQKDDSGDRSNDSGDQEAGHTMKASEVPVGRGTILEDQQIVVTQPEEGEFKAFSAVCTHKQCVVSDITEQAIVCQCHDSQYDLSTGEVLGGPAPEPLPAKKVQQENGTLTIR